MSKEYNYVFHTNKDGSITGYIDGLFGVAVQRDTLEECCEELKKQAEEIEGHFSKLGIPVQIGKDPLPLEDQCIADVYIENDDIIKHLANDAARKGITINTLIEEIIKDTIQNPTYYYSEEIPSDE